MMENFHVFDISFHAFNLLSFMLGVMFGATMWRIRAMFFVAFYFIGLATYFGVKYAFLAYGVAA